ncbi:MAG: condensation domain-containing protein, partial [Bacteroidota bacterium]
MKDIVFDLLKSAQKQGVSVFLEDAKIKISVADNRAIDRKLLADLGKYKSELYAFLEEEERASNTEKRAATEKIVKHTRLRDRVPLSYEQESIWLIDQIHGSLNYHMPITLKVKGQLDISALDHAFKKVLDRHEILKTVIEQDRDGIPYQKVLKETWHLDYVEECLDPEGEIDNFIHRPFRLDQDFMIRAKVIKQAPEWILTIVVHHIAFDGWSQQLFIDDLSIHYNSRIRGIQDEQAELPLQYADYSLWQRSYLSGSTLE